MLAFLARVFIQNPKRIWASAFEGTIDFYEVKQNTSAGLSYGDCFELNKPTEVTLIFRDKDGEYPKGRVWLLNDSFLPYEKICGDKLATSDQGKFSCTFSWTEEDDSLIKIHWQPFLQNGYVIINEVYNVKETCTTDEIDTNPPKNLSPANYESFKLCNQIPDGSSARTQCENCSNNDGIWTAVGCIPTDPSDMIKVLLRIGLMISGGVVLLTILAGSFILSTSAGDPKKTTEAKELISSAIIGLVFVIFSVSILQLIGVQILQIPGFGR